MEPVHTTDATEKKEEITSLSPTELDRLWNRFERVQPYLHDFVVEHGDDVLNAQEFAKLKQQVVAAWQAMLETYDSLPSVSPEDLEEALNTVRPFKEVREEFRNKDGLFNDELEERRKELFHSFPQQELYQTLSVDLYNAGNVEGFRKNVQPDLELVLRTVIYALNPSDEIEPFFQEDQEMSDRHILAAEYFNYSYANYQDHLGIGHARYERLMPEDVSNLRTAFEEDWPDEKIADELDVDPEKVPEIRKKFRRTLEIVDAPNPAESFRQGVRQSIEHALKEGLESDEDIRDLVVQICYRAADLGFLLDREDSSLSDYSKNLRSTPTANYSDRENPYDSWEPRDEDDRPDEQDRDREQ